MICQYCPQMRIRRDGESDVVVQVGGEVEAEAENRITRPSLHLHLHLNKNKNKDKARQSGWSLACLPKVLYLPPSLGASRRNYLLHTCLGTKYGCIPRAEGQGQAKSGVDSRWGLISPSIGGSDLAGATHRSWRRGILDRESTGGHRHGLKQQQSGKGKMEKDVHST